MKATKIVLMIVISTIYTSFNAEAYESDNNKCTNKSFELKFTGDRADNISDYLRTTRNILVKINWDRERSYLLFEDLIDIGPDVDTLKDMIELFTPLEFTKGRDSLKRYYIKFKKDGIIIERYVGNVREENGTTYSCSKDSVEADLCIELIDLLISRYDLAEFQSTGFDIGVADYTKYSYQAVKIKKEGISDYLYKPIEDFDRYNQCVRDILSQAKKEIEAGKTAIDSTRASN